MALTNLSFTDAVNLVQHSVQLERPVIVVTINYRVSIFGFLASKELQEELEESPEYQSLSTYDRSIGNWGLMDQKLAFEWVRENITAFGGNANNVTAFGESTSGTISGFPAKHVHKEGQALFNTLLEHLNIPLNLDSKEKMRRLRSIDQLELLDATRRLPPAYYPYYDNGQVFPALAADGQKPYNAWPSLLRHFIPFPELEAEAEQVYGIPETDADVERIFSKMIGDKGFAYPTHVLSDTLQDLQSARGVDQFKLLRYTMDVGMSKLEEIQPGLGATHGVDLPFVFGAPKLKALLTEAEVRLSKEMQRLWISFAYQQDYEAKVLSSAMRVPQVENGEAPIIPQDPSVMPVWRLAQEKEVEFDELNALNLNIFVPLTALKSEARVDPIPVMTWVHGGGFAWGSNADPLYDAVNLVQHSIQIERPVIVVTINYRVSIFGFLASKELQEELEESPEYPSLSTYDRSIGNWGLMDQKLAFEWVRENITAFGGNAKNVTAFGESAGAISLHYHMVLPSHHGLFDHAIMQSGTIHGFSARNVHKEGQALFNTLLGHLDIPLNLDSKEKMRRLRSIDQLELLDASRRLRPVYSPFYDNGQVFPALTADGLKPYNVQLAIRDVNAYDPNLQSVLLGSLKDEGTTFPRLFGKCTPQAWPFLLRHLIPFPELDAEAERVYGVPETDEDVERIFSEMFGDKSFTYPAHVLSDTLQNLQSARGVDQFKLMRYYMDVGMSKLDEMQPGLGATHGVELPFVFGAPKVKALLTGEEVRLSKEMQRLWISFAYQQDYEAKVLSSAMRVPQVENGEAYVMTSTHEVVIGKSNRLTEAQRAFWDRLAQMELAIADALV
ncbi:hypothetical protein BGZ68_010271 [Mortierella alpina]|nr:hypothetical protein BGZ68_010271 [Mortierella alpina]